MLPTKHLSDTSQLPLLSARARLLGFSIIAEEPFKNKQSSSHSLRATIATWSGNARLMQSSLLDRARISSASGLRQAQELDSDMASFIADIDTVSSISISPYQYDTTAMISRFRYRRIDVNTDMIWLHSYIDNSCIHD